MAKPKTHVKIMISIPRELNFVVNALVEESKNTAKPMTKSRFISVALYDYLERSLKILESKKPKKEEN